jgi:hypothetical protein
MARIAAPPRPTLEFFDQLPINDWLRTPWGNPEASINVLVATYGAWCCWDFLPDSPAGKLLTDQVQEDIINDLDAKLSKGEPRSIDCWTCEFWMVGMTEATACPTVVFCYPFEAKIRKKARNIIRVKIKQSNIRKVRVKSLNRGCPIEAAGTQKDALEEGKLFSPLDTRGYHIVQPGTVKLQSEGMLSCGSLIDTYYRLPDLHRSATLGGFLFAGKELYGITVSHTFHEDGNIIPAAPETVLFDEDAESDEIEVITSKSNHLCPFDNSF